MPTPQSDPASIGGSTSAGTGADSLSIKVGCEFGFDCEAAAPSIFQVHAYPCAEQSLVRESWRSEPPMPAREYLDSFGNRCLRVEMPSGKFLVNYDAVVEVGDRPDEVQPSAGKTSVEDLPAETLLFTLPSRYCLSDLLASTATDLFDGVEPGWSQVQAICTWVHDHITYTIGSTDVLSSAADVYHQRAGVCRDFAHLAISFCRALDYPTRYAFGYIPPIDAPVPPEGMDFAAWMEVFMEGRWFTFDPRNNQPLTGRVLVGRGRDAVDVAIVSSHGTHTLESMRVYADLVS